jgi:hypothetical protein
MGQGQRVTFDHTRVTSVDWSAYPILRFGNVPDSVDVHIIDRPGDVFFGVAEAAQGPSGVALANAIRDATGQRLRDLPFTAARIKEAIGVGNSCFFQVSVNKGDCHGALARCGGNPLDRAVAHVPGREGARDRGLQVVGRPLRRH